MSLPPNDPHFAAALAAYELVRQPIDRLLHQQQQMMQQQGWLIEQQQQQQRHNAALVQEVMDLRHELAALRGQLEATDAPDAPLTSSLGEQPQQQQQQQQQFQPPPLELRGLPVPLLPFVLPEEDNDDDDDDDKVLAAPQKPDSKNAAAVSAGHIKTFLSTVCQQSPSSVKELYESMMVRIWILGMKGLYENYPAGTVHNDPSFMDTRKIVVENFCAEMLHYHGVCLEAKKFQSDWLVERVFALRWGYEKSNEAKRKYVCLWAISSVSYKY